MDRNTDHTTRQGRFDANDIMSLLDVNRRYNLAESTSRDLRLDEILELAGVEDLGTIRLGYGSSSGLLALREAVADTCAVAPDMVLTTHGAVGALALVALTLCGSNDEVVIARPCFPPSRDLLRASGARVLEMRLGFDTSYALDPDRLEDLLSPRTRLVSLASPQNPSGVRIPYTVLRDVVSRLEARAPHAVLLIDETYREATYGAAAPAPSAAALDPRVLTASSVSKAHGAPGLRVGWLTVPDPALRERLKTARLNLSVSGSVLNETLAAGLLRRRETVLAPRGQVLSEALAVLSEWHAGEHGRLDWVRPDAGALCCFRLRSDVFGDRAVERFWQQMPAQDLQLGHGTWFGEDARVFRLGFGYLPLHVYRDALGALSRLLDTATAAGID